MSEDGYFKTDMIFSYFDVNYFRYLFVYKKFDEIKKYIFTTKYTRFLENIKAVLHYNKVKDFNNYILVDYSYIINNSSISTYHRDYTSSKQYNNLNFTSYTMILYLDNTNLNIIPDSHLEKFPIYLIDNSRQIKFNPGEAIIFDADLLHSGEISKTNEQRRCIQFKIVHKDDIENVKHLINYHNVNENKNNNNYYLKLLYNNISRMIPFVSDIFNKQISNSFHSHKTKIQEFISYLFYSSTDFFKPKFV